MKNHLTEPQMIAKIKAAADQCDSRAEFARKVKVSPQYLSDVIGGHRPPGDAITRPLGFERVVIYREKA